MRPPTPAEFSRANERARAIWRVRVWLAVFHLATLVGAVQLSALAQVVTGLVSACAGDEDNCPNEKPGRDCPPGCPSCHCAHAVAATPRAAPLSLVPAVAAEESLRSLDPRVPPPSPPPSGVWRPPRKA
jgi:hypothetical protein